MNLTRFGIWTSYGSIGNENAGEAARLLQDLGFGAVWLGGSPDPDELRPMLAATDTLVAATGITNIWSSDATEVAAQHAALVQEYTADRVLCGVGAGHPEATSDYSRPRHATIAFLDALDQAPTPLPDEQRVLAALGPKMLDLCAERSLGRPIPTSPRSTTPCSVASGSAPARSSPPRSPASSTPTPSARRPPRASTPSSTWGSATTPTTCCASASPRMTSLTAARTS